jgi:hypothetical protein
VASVSIVEAGWSASTGTAQAPLADDISLARVASIVDAGGGQRLRVDQVAVLVREDEVLTHFCKESLWDATEKLKLVDDQGSSRWRSQSRRR